VKIRSILLRNFLIIQKADLSLDDGLTAVTGETGSGKSLFVEAVKLLLGGKAHKGLTGPWGKTGEVAAIIEVEPCDRCLREDLDTLGIEPEEDRAITMRRVIGEKSLLYLNGSPVAAQDLQRLFADRMEISSQFENRELFKPEYQLSVLDAVALTEELEEAYAVRWRELRSITDEMEGLRRQDDPARRDYLEFQIREIEEFRPQAGEEERLKQRLSLLDNRKKIEELIAKSDEGLHAAVSALNPTERALADLSRIADLGDLPARASSALIECRDLQRTLAAFSGRMDPDESNDDDLRERYDRLNRLLMKHGVKDAIALIERHDEMKKELTELSRAPERIDELDRRRRKVRDEAEKTALKMRKERQKAIAPLEKRLTDHLLRFGMDRVVFKLDLAPSDDLCPAGLDTLRFLINTIGSGDLYGIKNLSGGELSRLLLALKLVDNDSGRFILFDEIDANIGGEVAARAAEELKKNSLSNQILVVTHFPQTAARAGAHLVVEKSTFGAAMESSIRPVAGDERVRELARMMGDSSSKENLTAARKLLRATH